MILLDQGQQDPNAKPSGLVCIGLDLSCLGFHQVFADGQPKPASAAGPVAGFIDSKKMVEEMRQHVFIHRQSVIAETEQQS